MNDYSLHLLTVVIYIDGIGYLIGYVCLQTLILWIKENVHQSELLIWEACPEED